MDKTVDLMEPEHKRAYIHCNSQIFHNALQKSNHIYQITGWLVALRINVDLAIFQPNLDLEAGNNQSLKIQVARPGIEPRSSCSASQELNHSATAAPSHIKLHCCIS